MYSYRNTLKGEVSRCSTAKLGTQRLIRNTFFKFQTRKQAPITYILIGPKFPKYKNSHLILFNCKKKEVTKSKIWTGTFIYHEIKVYTISREIEELFWLHNEKKMPLSIRNLNQNSEKWIRHPKPHYHHHPNLLIRVRFSRATARP